MQIVKQIVLKITFKHDRFFDTWCKYINTVRCEQLQEFMFN